MGKYDLDPRTIDLNRNVNLAIEILFQYEYVAQEVRLHYGTITACLRKGSALDRVYKDVPYLLNTDFRHH